jgi:hypothetical protein
MDFAKLLAEQCDALDGAEREAWYAWRNGDTARATAILNAYGIETAAAPRPARRSVAKTDAAES